MSAIYIPFRPAVYSGIMGRFQTMADCNKNAKPKKVNPAELTDKEKMEIIESQDRPLVDIRKLDPDDPDLEGLDEVPRKPKKAPTSDKASKTDKAPQKAS